jgi:hypothetical protein
MWRYQFYANYEGQKGHGGSKMILKRVGVLSFGKVSGVIYGLLGLIFGVIFALFSLLGAGIAATQTGEPTALFGVVFGVGAVIFMPLFYGAMGFIVGVVMAALYNLVAGWVGGVELYLSDGETKHHQEAD